MMAMVDVIGPAVVGDDVIELRGGLIVLGAPGFSGVGGDCGTTVVAVDEAFGIVWINPQAVMVSMRRGKEIESSAAVHGAKHSGVEDINGVR